MDENNPSVPPVSIDGADPTKKAKVRMFRNGDWELIGEVDLETTERGLVVRVDKATPDVKELISSLLSIPTSTQTGEADFFIPNPPSIQHNSENDQDG